jgi:plastocyanin
MKSRAFTLSGMVLTASMLMVAPLALTGCQDNKVDHPNSDVGFSINASHTDIMVGETVTLTARTTDTLGRDVDVKWTSTGGNLDTERGNRIARVTFDKPGTYSVRGDLYLNGNVYKSDQKVITVKQIR